MLETTCEVNITSGTLAHARAIERIVSENAISMATRGLYHWTRHVDTLWAECAIEEAEHCIVLTMPLPAWATESGTVECVVGCGFVGKQMPDYTRDVQGIPTRLDESEFSIYRIAVSPAFQGQGLGRLLMKNAETLARSSGGKKVWLDWATPNQKLAKFYQQLGFIIKGSSARATFASKELL